jgi:DUF971 family protein
MVDQTLKPTSIQADRQKDVLTIHWNDGHTSHFGFTLLRAACPCASCRGGHENMRSTPDPAVFTIELPDTPAVHLEKAELVGAYAINFEWKDGHHYGIYNWAYLRDLCPCESCRERRS